MENQNQKTSRKFFPLCLITKLIIVFIIINIITNGIFIYSTSGYSENQSQEDQTTSGVTVGDLIHFSSSHLEENNKLMSYNNLITPYRNIFLNKLLTISDDPKKAVFGFLTDERILVDELHSFSKNSSTETLSSQNTPIGSVEFYEDIINNLTTKYYIKDKIEINNIEIDTSEINNTETNNIQTDAKKTDNIENTMNSQQLFLNATFTMLKNSEFFVLDFVTVDIPQKIKTEGKFGIIKQTDTSNQLLDSYLLCYMPNDYLSETKIITPPNKIYKNADSTKSVNSLKSKNINSSNNSNTSKESNTQNTTLSSYNELTQTSSVKAASSSSFDDSKQYLGSFSTTAYCNCSHCCGKWAGGPTKIGTMPVSGRTIAVDPNVIPLGSKVLINGNVYIAEDTGSAIKGKKIDIYFGSHSQALNYGRRTVEVYLLY